MVSNMVVLEFFFGSGTVDGALKKSNLRKRISNWEKAFVEGAIGLKTNSSKSSRGGRGQNAYGNIAGLRQSGDGVWK